MKSVYTRFACFTGIGTAIGFYRNFIRYLTVCLLCFQAFESTLKSWEDKQKCELSRPSSFSLQPEIMSEEESTQINQFGQAAGALIHRWASVCFWWIEPSFGAWSSCPTPVPGVVSVHSYLLQCWSMSLGVTSFIMQCPICMRAEVE